ncbi:protein of unknown function [Blastococcus saxobsidens DD2]|uniref:Uncharacterized protein n=1 Tax=Blastococcus saxobsidens (strain DD2) TaxID=1146883 RepID=H6RMD6_BLASD|nr:protein of unknown function [Blastococcus saxobsidens DD2]
MADTSADGVRSVVGVRAPRLTTAAPQRDVLTSRATAFGRESTPG